MAVRVHKAFPSVPLLYPFSDAHQWDCHRGSSSRGCCLSGTRTDTVPSLSLLDGAKNSVQSLHYAADPETASPQLARKGCARQRGHRRRDTRNSTRCFHASPHTRFPRRVTIPFSTRSGHRLIPVKSRLGRLVTAIASTPATRPPRVSRQTRGTMQGLTPVIPHGIP